MNERDISPGPGTVTVRPNPAPAGGEVEVEYDGDPPLYVRTFGGGKWVPVDLGTGRQGKVRVPVGAGLLLFTTTPSRPSHSRSRSSTRVSPSHDPAL